MTYDVLVQSQREGEFSATVIGWPMIVARGRSEQAVVEKARRALRAQLSHSKIVHLSEEDIASNESDSAHPWKEFLGMWQDDELFDDFVDQMQLYRDAQDSL